MNWRSSKNGLIAERLKSSTERSTRNRTPHVPINVGTWGVFLFCAFHGDVIYESENPTEKYSFLD